VGAEIAVALQQPGGTRRRLLAPCFNPQTGAQPAALLESTLAKVIAVEALERRLQTSARDGILREVHPHERIAEAQTRGVIDESEARTLMETLEQVEAVCRVDEFDAGELAGRA
jgi:acyl-CoA dehydrogenase